MKAIKHLILISLCLGLFVQQSDAQCVRLKKKRMYTLLGAAEYDNHRNTEILASPHSHIEEYQINLFKGVVYKLVFDASSMPEGVIINLYDLGKKRGAGKYELVFTSEKAELNENGTYEVTMEFPQRKMMVQYITPNNTKAGCVSFVLGYYFKNRIR